MKKSIFSCLSAVMAFLGLMLGGCSEYTPEGYTEVASLPTAKNVKAIVANHVVNLSWQLPQAKDIEGVVILENAKTLATLPATDTSYAIEGKPMGEETLFTVKVLYSDNRLSTGVSTVAVVPVEELAPATGLQLQGDMRKVTLSWTLPNAGGITGVNVIVNGDKSTATYLEGLATTCTLTKQTTGEEQTYAVEVVYDKYYASAPLEGKITLPLVITKAAYLMSAPSIAQLDSDDEQAAAAWFDAQENCELIWPNQIATLDPDEYTVIWICIDRNGIGKGWENLPAEITNAGTIADLKTYFEAGGALYLSNMATQLTVPMGILTPEYAPNIFGDGAGGSGTDVWVINPFLGVDFKDGGAQGYYDRSEHAIFQGLTLEDPNGYGYLNLPLIGPGEREDHNCMWDCNAYGAGSQKDVIKNFEVTTNSLVLATWGHVRDHCVAGLVDFFPTPNHGRCVANGFAAYEWNQNSGANPYQGNIEGLTKNILNYLK